MGSPTLSDGSASWNVLVAGLYVVVVAIASSSAGGYIAGRMRSKWANSTEAEVEFRDEVHGLVVWATATLGVAVVMGVLTALSALGASAAAAADAAENTREYLASDSEYLGNIFVRQCSWSPAWCGCGMVFRNIRRRTQRPGPVGA